MPFKISNDLTKMVNFFMKIHEFLKIKIFTIKAYLVNKILSILLNNRVTLKKIKTLYLRDDFEVLWVLTGLIIRLLK